MSLLIHIHLLHGQKRVNSKFDLLVNEFGLYCFYLERVKWHHWLTL